MFQNVSNSVDVTLSVSIIVLVAVVVGHLYLGDLLTMVQWVAETIVGPLFGLDSHF